MKSQERSAHDAFFLRMEDGLREKLKAAAAENRRSMTAEINLRLVRSLERKTDTQKSETAGAATPAVSMKT